MASPPARLDTASRPEMNRAFNRCTARIGDLRDSKP
jgi:hypothetical protein